MPFFATLDRRERYVAIKGISSVRRIGPRYFIGEVPHNFPMGKKNLHLRSIGKAPAEGYVEVAAIDGLREWSDSFDDDPNELFAYVNSRVFPQD